jgi:hypothetical protein
MIKVYNANIRKLVPAYNSHLVFVNDGNAPPYYAMRFQLYPNDPNSKLSVCFSDYLDYQRDDNYIEINGQKYKYYNICKSFDKIQVMIEQDSINEALEALP